jgi:predicted esterase
MVRHLPPPVEMPPLPTGTAVPINVQDMWNRTLHRYSVVLPPEYAPHHAYPLLVVLRAEGRTTEQELTYWAGTPERPGPAQGRGYVVVAPDYAHESQGTYEYAADVHDTVLACINDARRRFRIDSDRIYLAGHGMGADACFDLGMSHPGVFAGVVPMTGVSDRFCMFYRRNAPELAWYVVAGERDPDGLEASARDLNDMMKQGHDVIYCEYKARGVESYYEELPRIFDWMELHRRATPARQWEYKILRHTDNKLRWLELAGLPAKLSEPIVWDPPGSRPRPLTITGNIMPGNTIFVRHQAQETTLWLSPELVDFDERLRVNVNVRQQFNDYLQPDLGALLEDLRLRGDRERLYWARLVL